jgi:uncharacterized protein with GYD domain
VLTLAVRPAKLIRHRGGQPGAARQSRGKIEMPKYLFISSLTQEGLRGTLSEGGTARRDAIRRATEGLGGKLEAYYYAFGDRDAYTIVDLPDNATAAAASAAVSAGGAAKVTTVVLITPEEMDEVGKKNVQAYVPPRA